MNNYLNYNFSNMYNNLNKKESNEYKTNSLYDPYQGFIRGNMFEQLYNQYKIKEPYDIRPMNQQAELLTYIDSLSFACIDLNLYLDVHPDNHQIIDLYNQYRNQKKKATEEYENKYGPLLLDSDSLNSYPWSWNDKPWPWEN